MNPAWAIRFAFNTESEAGVASAVGRLRLLADVEATLSDQSRLWVAGPSLDDDLLRCLRSLPCEERFRVDSNRTLTKLDEKTPTGVLPAGEWIPISELVELELPVAGVSLGRIPRVPATLVRSSEPVEPQCLLVPADVAVTWAASASQVRLDRLTFAVSDDGRVLFRGSPLPSMPGVLLSERELVLVPAGWTWSPAINAKSLRTSLEASAEELVLLNKDGEFEKIPESEFVAASRSAIRVSTTRKATP